MDHEYKEKLLNSKETIFVADLTGKSASYPFLPDMTAGNLKELISYKGVPVNQQTLSFAGRRLENDKMLGIDYYIYRESTIHLIYKLRGGMFSETSGRAGNFKALKQCFFHIESNSP